jgi:hypothetical protein
MSNPSRERVGHWGRRLAVAVVAAAAGVAIGTALWPPPEPPSHEKPDAVIALSSSVLGDSSLDAAGSGRLRVAAREAEAHGVPLYTTRFVSEDGISTDIGQRRLLAALGYRGEWATTDSLVHTTRDEAVVIRRMLPGVATVEVVTSAMHARRACAAFAATGFRVECAARYDEPWWSRPLELPYEILAVIKYRWKGWLR